MAGRVAKARRGWAVAAATLTLAIGTIVVGYGTGWLSRFTPMLADDAEVPVTDVPKSPPPTALRMVNGKRTLTVAGAGDVLVHPEVWYQARQDAVDSGFDFLPMFRHAASVISGADLAICHLETPLAGPAGPFTGFPKFSVPPQLVDALKEVGYDACSTSSNHAIDHGEAGITRTLNVLDERRLGHTGSYRSPREASIPTIYTVAGVRVGHLSYTRHLNGLAPPAGKEWLVNVIQPERILAAARKTRAAGAQIIILSLHWGTEYDHKPDVDQLKWVKSLISSADIDLILGHHAHVVQPFEKFGNEWVAYGLGNQLARHAEPINDNREGVLARFTFTEVTPRRWTVTRAEAIPTWVDLNPDIRLLDLPTALADPRTPVGKRGIYQAAYERVRRYVAARGADRAGLTVVAAGGRP